ncbi:MAG: hypothetical protein U5J78_06685 [Parasphingorhabdus sp.]|nr:hypothetical protein [Parasphingorhabdus sp.]
MALNSLKSSVIAVAFAGTLAAAAVAQVPDLSLLAGLKSGGWVLKVRGSDEAPRKICLGDRSQLLHPEHVSTRCSQYVIEDTPNDLRVSYKCGALGHGVTSIHRETNNLVQIKSQGILRGAPFSVAYEARYTGAC